MEDIKVGEWVRTYNGLIGKVNKIEAAGSGCRFAGEFLKDEIIQFNDGKIYERRCKREQVSKHSFKLIDLLEVGDYVNGYRVHKITSACIYFTGKAVQNKLTMNIESILTHEQFEVNAYKVKGER